MFINLIVKFTKGPRAGEVMPLMCLGEQNLLYRLDDIAPTDVAVVGIEVTDGQLTAETQKRVQALIEEGQRKSRD